MDFAMALRLFVGNQRYSSWSLRPWLCLEQSGLTFETVVLRFDDPQFKAKLGGPTGKVPTLVDGALVVHESLAIGEYVAELAPAAGLWPDDASARAQARALATEMHAGFASLRSDCSMDVCREEAPGVWPISAATRADVARIDQIFREGLERSGGPFLFGRFGVVDAMFAPVVTRILSYSLEVSPGARRYVEHVRALPAMARWYEAGVREKELGWGHYSGGSRAPRGHEDAMAFALRWAEAWNRRDVEAVLARFADDVVFVSPKAKDVTGSAEVRGKLALREYWTEAADRLSASHRFEVERVELDVDANTLVIRNVRREADRLVRACEVLTFDPRSGLVTAGEAYYGA
jgi:glutathione S-transferase